MSKKLLYKILAIIAGFVLIGAAVGENHRISRLKRYGTAATVIPPESYTDHIRKGQHTFTAEIAFKIADGNTMKSSHSVPEAAIDAMKAHQPVTVYYDPRDPSEFVFDADAPDYWMPVLGVAIMVAAFFLL